MRYFGWPHRCKRRLSHFLYKNQCDCRSDGPTLRVGDEVVFCIVRLEMHWVWARAVVAGEKFRLPPNEVWDTDFQWAVPLKAGLVRWPYPPPQGSGLNWMWLGLHQVSPREFQGLVNNKNCRWQGYPYPLDPQYPQRFVGEWASWRCLSVAPYSSCNCKQRPYEDPPSAPGVRLGDSVRLRELLSGQVTQYTLVPPGHSNPPRISIDAPLGKAVHWKKKGDVVWVQAPGGSSCYEIEEIL